MGYFNFWYNLKFFLRRFPKKILVGIIIILLLFIFSTQSHAVDHVVVDNTSNVDAFQYFKTRYDYNWGVFLNRAIYDARRNNNTFNNKVRYFCQVINQGLLSRVWYIDMVDASETFLNSSNQSFITAKNYICFGYSNFTDENDRLENYLYAYSSYSSNVNNSRRILSFIYKTDATAYYLFDRSYVYNDFQGIVHLNIPSGLEHYIPTEYINIVDSIARGTFDFTSSEEILHNIDNNLDELNQTMTEFNDFIQDDTTSQYSQNDLPSDSLNDITASGFNNIFTRIYNSVTSRTNQSVNITIPYLDYPVSVDSNFVYNALNNNGFTAIISIFDTVYYGLISLYIIKDIYKYINQIKNGDIGHTDTNIKTEVL